MVFLCLVGCAVSQKREEHCSVHHELIGRLASLSVMPGKRDEKTNKIRSIKN